MTDELDIDTEEVSSEDQPGETTVTPGDSTVEDDRIQVALDGLETTKKELLSNYHEKMDDIKEVKEDLAGMKAENKKEREFLIRSRSAMKNDEVYFRTHNLEESQGYESEYDKVLKEDPSSPVQSEPVAKSEVDPGTQKRLDELEARDRARDKADRLRAADDSVVEAEKLIKTKYVLADIDTVKDKCIAFFALNKRVPSDKEVGEIVKKTHDTVAKITESFGGTVPGRKIGNLPDGKGTVPGSEEKIDLKPIGDLNATSKELDEFIRRRELQHEAKT